MAEESISLSNVVEFGIVAMQELLEFHQEEVEGSCRSFVTFIQWILTRSITERAKVAEVIQKSRELLDLITAWLMHSSAGLSHDPVCRWLYDWIVSGDSMTQRFVLNFVPVLIHRVFLANAALKPSSVSGILVCVMGIATLQDESFDNLILLPSKPMIQLFSEPETSSNILTSNVLSSGLSELPDVQDIASDSTPDWHIDIIRAISVFNAEMAFLPIKTLYNFCEMCQAVIPSLMPDFVDQPTPPTSGHQTNTTTQATFSFRPISSFVSVSPGILKVLLVGLGQCCSTAECQELAKGIIRNISAIAEFSLDPELMLLSTSLQNMIDNYNQDSTITFSLNDYSNRVSFT